MAKKTELMKPETHATPTAQDIIAELNALGNPDKAAHLSLFSKPGKVNTEKEIFSWESPFPNKEA